MAQVFGAEVSPRVTEATIAPTLISGPLDDYLREVVQTLHAAVSQGMRRAADDPRAATPQIADCEEIIGVIMAGKVNEWL